MLVESWKQCEWHKFTRGWPCWMWNVHLGGGGALWSFRSNHRARKPDQPFKFGLVAQHHLSCRIWSCVWCFLVITLVKPHGVQNNTSVHRHRSCRWGGNLGSMVHLPSFRLSWNFLWVSCRHTRCAWKFSDFSDKFFCVQHFLARKRPEIEFNSWKLVKLL